MTPTRDPRITRITTLPGRLSPIAPAGAATQNGRSLSPAGPANARSRGWLHPASTAVRSGTDRFWQHHGVNAFRHLLRVRLEAAVHEAAAAADLEHSGLTGAAREALVERVFRPVIDPAAAFGTGKLVYSSGAKSNQIDVIIHAPSVAPPALYHAATGLYPIEGALYAIEVKSTLTATTLQQAVDNARSILALSPIPTRHVHPLIGGDVAEYQMPLPVRALFAFGSDTTNPATEFNRLMRNTAGDGELRPLDAVCVVGVGYWYWRSAEGHAPGWVQHPAGDFQEVMTFLAGITNTIPDIIAFKGKPRFGNYLAAEDDGVFLGTGTTEGQIS
jgi:Domain of unknown function (DUF6602)